MSRPASSLKQLVRCSIAAAILLPALWAAIAVTAATPARRPRPNGPRSRVSRSLHWASQSTEGVELHDQALDNVGLSLAQPNDTGTSYPETVILRTSYPKIRLETGSESPVSKATNFLPRLGVPFSESPRGPPLA